MSRYNYLLTEIDTCKPNSILEIGTWNGNHAFQMIEQAKKYHQKQYIQYYGFDLFEDFKEHELEYCPKKPARKSDVEKLLNQTGVYFQLIQGNTRKTLAEATNIPPIDFIFIDGGHSRETIKSDWDNIQKFIYHKTTILFDDYYPENDKQGCKFLINDLEEDENWLIWLLKSKDKTYKGENIYMIKIRLAASIP